MGRGSGIAELGNKVELDQLGLELWLNWSLEHFPGWCWGGSGEKLGINHISSQLQVRLYPLFL